MAQIVELLYEVMQVSIEVHILLILVLSMVWIAYLFECTVCKFELACLVLDEID